MRLKSILILSALSILLPASAHAQDGRPEYKAGLNYADFGATKPEKKPSEETSAPLQPYTPDLPKIVKIPKPPKPNLKAADLKQQEESPEIRIWNKYKALAGGTDKKDQNTDKSKTTIEQSEARSAAESDNKGMKTWSAPEQPGKNNAREKTDSSTKLQQDAGITALLQDWKNSKDRQNDLRSKNFAVPDGLGTSTKTQAK